MSRAPADLLAPPLLAFALGCLLGSAGGDNTAELEAKTAEVDQAAAELEANLDKVDELHAFWKQKIAEANDLFDRAERVRETWEEFQQWAVEEYPEFQQLLDRPTGPLL